MADFLLERFLPYQMAVAASRVSRDFEAIYRERFGIGVAEWRVMAQLSQGDRVSVREIHRRVDMEKSRVSRASSRLESAGFIRKQANPEDGRLVELCLTERGRAMIDEIAPLAQEFERNLADKLGAGAGAFRAGLDRLIEDMEREET